MRKKLIKYSFLTLTASAALFSCQNKKLLSSDTKTATVTTNKIANTTNKDYLSYTNDPINMRVYTLSNGLKVFISVNKNSPKIDTKIAVRTGSKNDPDNATGLAHYLDICL